MIKLILPLLLESFLLISANPPKTSTPHVTALFGPRNNFICNAVVLAKGRLLTTADCLVFMNNGTQRLGVPEDFQVVLNATDIERFVGVRSGKPARRRIMDKLSTRGGDKFDNKFSNEVFSNKFDRDELDYLLKGLFTYDVGKEQYGSFVNVTNLMVHPGYRGSLKNDLAILEVPDSKVFQQMFLSVNLSEDLGFNRVVQVYGWGDIAREYSRNMTYQLKTVEMYLLPPARCAEQVGNLFLPSQHLCLKPKGNETICLVKFCPLIQAQISSNTHHSRDSRELQSSWTEPCLASSNSGILNVTLTRRSWAPASDPLLTFWA